jgi:dTDP-4-dehydrorhamnose reductase
MADVDACEQMPEAAMQLNGHLPGRLASACAERGISCVQVSTDMVYDGPGPHAEFDVVPLNVYARTKLEGDARVVDAGGCVLRTNFFGTSRHRSRRSFSDWLLEGFRADRELPLLGDVFFSPLRMESLCAWIGTVLRDPANGEVLNLGSRTGMTKRDFALKLANACGHANVRERPVTLQELRLAARRPTDMRMDVGKFEERYRTELPSLGQEIEIAARVGTGADLPWESSRGNSGSPTSLRAEEEGKR